MKISSFTFALASWGLNTVNGEPCTLTAPEIPMTFNLADYSGLSFVGTHPIITRVEGEPAIKILQYSSEPMISTSDDGKLVVSSSMCVASVFPSEFPTKHPTKSPTKEASEQEESGTFRIHTSRAVAVFTSAALMYLGGSDNLGLVGIGATLLSMATSVSADMTCEDVMEVEIHGPVKSLGATYMEDMIDVKDYDGSEESFHFDAEPSWVDDVKASRKFRETASGGAYNYRNKVLMGLAQTRVLNDPPYVTPKEDVVFDIPDVDLPDTDEGIMMLSVLEMQGLLRAGKISSVNLTMIALEMLEKYDPEYNMLEVELKDLAMEVAEKADEMFAAGTYSSAIQGIPFAVKDTYDVKGYATAYGSFEALDNVVDTESPLVTYAIQAGGVPLFKSSVPQLTWGYANYKGAVYSCLNGGFSAGAGGSGGSSIGSANAVCLGVVPVAICEQTGSSCQAPAIANGISTLIPALGTFSRENNGLYSMESDRPGLLCRDVMSCAAFYNYMRGTSPGDPQSRGVPFSDPSKEDISTYTVGFTDNSDTQGWPEAWDTPLKGKRGNVVDALKSMVSEVIVKEELADFMEPTQLLNDYHTSGIGSKWFGWFDWYYLNVEGFFETVFKYGGKEDAVDYGPVWEGQNFNFDNGHHKQHIGATAYAYLDDLWLFGYVSEMAMYPMLQTLPDVVVHFAQSELNGAHNLGMIKRAGINTVHIPEFYWNTTDSTFVDWTGSRPIDFYSETTITAAMITCESKKYEPVKAMAVCYQLQQSLVENGKLISPYKDIIHDALKTGKHDLNCPYNWTYIDPDYLEAYPADIKERVLAAQGNRGTVPTCGASTGGGCSGGTCSDVRLKKNIQPFGVSSSGIPMYTFQYKPNHVKDVDSGTTFVGAMAQDLVALNKIDAVCRHKDDGYLRVDYSKIDVDFMML